MPTVALHPADPEDDKIPEKITELLRHLGEGVPGEEDRLFPFVYQELRRLARRSMRGERAWHTLQPTALVNEAYLRLRSQSTEYQDRAHFFRVAAAMMRHILVDHARRRDSAKRGGGIDDIPLDEALTGWCGIEPEKLIAINRALDKLAELDARQAEIVEMRFFAGLTEEEIGLLLGISERTVKREWRIARRFLAAELGGDEDAL